MQRSSMDIYREKKKKKKEKEKKGHYKTSALH